MTARHSGESPVALELHGSQAQPSAPDVAQAATPTVDVRWGGASLKMDAEAVQTIICLFEGLLSETLSGDKVKLAFLRAESLAEKYGIDPKRFAEIGNVIYERNEIRRTKNPFVAGGFFA
jgi:hypothetical protein